MLATALLLTCLWFLFRSSATERPAPVPVRVRSTYRPDGRERF